MISIERNAVSPDLHNWRLGIFLSPVRYIFCWRLITMQLLLCMYLSALLYITLDVFSQRLCLKQLTSLTTSFQCPGVSGGLVPGLWRQDCKRSGFC